MEHSDLRARLDLIETMIADGRRDTEYWGWAFVLWGVGHAVALLWSRAGGWVAWPVTMTLCGVLMGIGAARVRRRGRKITSLGRALGAVWISLGVGMFLAGMVGGMTGFLTGATIPVFFFIMMGAASLSSALILRWPVWFAVALGWWAAAVVAMIAPITTVWWLSLGTAMDEVIFGAYLMALERREAASAEAAGP